MTAHAPTIPHPRIAERRKAVKAETAAKSRHRVRRRVLWATLAVIILGVSGYLSTQSELLDVDTLTVRGASRTTNAEILEAAGIRRGEPLMGLDLAAARARIAELPWVAEVRSNRAWNGSVSFRVTERAPLAAVATATAWATVDNAGRILAAGPAFPSNTVPVLGLDVPTPVPGEWLARSTLPALQVAEALYQPLRAEVRAVVVADDGLRLDLHRGGVVQLGDVRDLHRKLVAVHTFLEKVDLHCLDRLDVRAAGTPVLTRRAGCL